MISIWKLPKKDRVELLLKIKILKHKIEKENDIILDYNNEIIKHKKALSNIQNELDKINKEYTI